MEAIYTHHRQVSSLALISIIFTIRNYHHAGGYTWTQTSALSGYWNGVASDSTGQYLVATQSYSQNIFISDTG